MQFLRIPKVQYFFSIFFELMWNSEMYRCRDIMAQSVVIKRQNKNDCRHPMLRVFYTKPYSSTVRIHRNIISAETNEGVWATKSYIYIFTYTSICAIWNDSREPRIGKRYSTSASQWTLRGSIGLFEWVVATGFYVEYSFVRDMCIKRWLFV